MSLIPTPSLMNVCAFCGFGTVLDGQYVNFSGPRGQDSDHSLDNDHKVTGVWVDLWRAG